MAKDPFNIPQAEFRNKAATFNTIVGTDFAALGISSAQKTELNTLFGAFDAAFSAGTEPATRTKATIDTKQEQRRLLTSFLRELSRIIKANPAVSNAQLIDLGLNPRDVEPTPIDRPGSAPVIDEATVVGRTVSLKIRASGSESRGKPDGVDCVEVFSYVGNAPPADVRDYVSEGSSTKTDFDVAFPPAIPAGSQVFLVAWWKNPRQQPGPLCTPTSVYLGGGASAAA